MADHVISATGDVVFHINNAAAGLGADVWEVWKRTDMKVQFRVLEDGVVYPTRELRRGAPLVFSDSDTGSADFAYFKREAVTRLTFRYDSSQVFVETPAGGDINLALDAPSVRFIPDADADSGPNFVRVRNGAGNDRLVIGDDLSIAWHDTTNTAQMAHVVSGNDVTLTIGRTANLQGKLKLRAQRAGAVDRAGVLELSTENGSRAFLWVNTSGALMLHTSDPAADDAPTGCVVVGTQS